MVDPFRGFGRRVRRKAIALLPLLGGAVILLILITCMLNGMRAYLPGDYQQLLDLLTTGDLVAGRALLRNMLAQHGGAQQGIFLIIQVAQVLLAPIPAQLTGLLGGYLFGFWTGLGLTMTGLTIGSTLAIGMGRLLGAGVVRKIIPAQMYAEFERLASESGVWGFVLIFLLPVFPGDSVCFIAGLSRLPMWQLVLASAIGRLPGMALLTYMGATSEQYSMAATVLLAVLVLAGVALWLYSEEVAQWCNTRLGRPAGLGADHHRVSEDQGRT